MVMLGVLPLLSAMTFFDPVWEIYIDTLGNVSVGYVEWTDTNSGGSAKAETVSFSDATDKIVWGASTDLPPWTAKFTPLSNNWTYISVLTSDSCPAHSTLTYSISYVSEHGTQAWKDTEDPEIQPVYQRDRRWDGDAAIIRTVTTPGGGEEG